MTWHGNSVSMGGGHVMLLDFDFTPWYPVPGMSFESTTSKKVGDLLGSNSRERIVVPTFQRGYEWGTKHVEAFWRDFIRFHKRKDMAGQPKSYFLGPIVTLKSKTEGVVELLDGQQRLATATILLCVIRDLAQSAGTPEGESFARDTQNQLIEKENGGYALELGETDATFFRETIQGSNRNMKPVLRTHRNIKAAYATLKECVKRELPDNNPIATINALKPMRLTLRADFLLACIPVESERDAFLVFETLNDRGLRLAPPDLLLNYLMREAKQETDRPQIRALWNDMVENMGQRDIGRFLRHLWISKHGDLKDDDLYSALKTLIETDENQSGHPKRASLEFAQDCAAECVKYSELLSADEEALGKGAALYVKSLVRELESQASLPLLLSFCSAGDVVTEKLLTKVCQLIIVFIARHSILSGLDTAGAESVLFALAKEVRDMPKSQTTIAACVTHIKDTLVKHSPGDPHILSSVDELILSPEGAKYIVTRLAKHIQSKTHEVTYNRANVEHIYPKNPNPSDWGGSNNQDKLDPYLWHIGNLTLLGKKLNQNAANKEYKDKRTEHYQGSELTMTRDLAKAYQKWTVAEIKHRANALKKPILEIWNFENTSRV